MLLRGCAAGLAFELDTVYVRIGTPGLVGKGNCMSAEFQHPKHECDLVMRGGVTSGIVYPRAVLGLQKHNRFPSIGGASAGAIAAALTAAAEYGRESGGFTELEKAQKQVLSDRFLRNLFQHSAETLPLMDTALALKSLLDSQKEQKWERAQLLRDLGAILKSNNPKAYHKGRSKGMIWAYSRAWGRACSCACCSWCLPG